MPGREYAVISEFLSAKKVGKKGKKKCLKYFIVIVCEDAYNGAHLPIHANNKLVPTKTVPNS